MMRSRLALASLIVLFVLQPAIAFEPMLMKESIGADANFGTPCLLSGNTNGTCANYRWYNLCSGYIWIYHGWPLGAGVGVLFGGQEQPCVAPGNVVKRAITYYRNTAPTYACRIAVSLERDVEGDGCPDGSLASECFDPSLRWNCSEFNQTIPEGTEYLIVRQYKADQSGLDYLPGFATDGPFIKAASPSVLPDRSRTLPTALASRGVVRPIAPITSSRGLLWTARCRMRSPRQVGARSKDSSADPPPHLVSQGSGGGEGEDRTLDAHGRSDELAPPTGQPGGLSHDAQGRASESYRSNSLLLAPVCWRRRVERRTHEREL
jgi:hypothetical protein